MRVLITGGLGFIGSNLLELLISKPKIKQIIIVDNQSKSSLEYIDTICEYKYFSKSNDYTMSRNKVVVVNADITNYKFSLRVTKNIDYTIHLAAESGIETSIKNPKQSFNINVNGTMNYLEASRINKVRGFIFSSSGAVFGTSKPPMKEFFNRAPISPYGSSKLSIESFCETYSSVFNMNTTILRFSNVYGKYSAHKSSVITTFINNILHKKPLKINGDGKHTRDYIYASDLCRAIYQSILKCKGCNIFHVSTGKETSINKLIKKIFSIFSKKKYKMPSLVYKSNRPGDMRFNSLSTTYIQKKLKWENKTNLDKGLHKTISWYLK
tara:strand:- start:287 stop:1261 length:975 start_codon:yes stop_codon:yes gene_type:complete